MARLRRLERFRNAEPCEAAELDEASPSKVNVRG
jgi:hypothetical protein